MSQPQQNQNPNQRQGGAGRGAGGAAGQAVASAASPQDLTSLLGSALRLTLSNNSIVTGSLWAYDSALATVVLETGVQPPSIPIPTHAAASPSPALLQSHPSSNTKSSGFLIIKTREISNIQVTQLSKDQEPSKDLQFVKELTSIHPVNVEAAKRREEAAIKEGHARAARKGKDVSQLAQEVFDGLSKT